jgi:hypothetical protein
LTAERILLPSIIAVAVVSMGRSIAIGSHVSHLTVRAGSALRRMGEVSRSSFSNRPLLSHQQTSVFRRQVEHLIDLMAVQVNSIDDLGKFPSESNPHN